MIITHNLNYLKTVNKLTKNEKDTSTSMKRISSGLKINSASDNASGSAISSSLKAKILSLSRAQLNVQEGLGVSNVVTSSLTDIIDDGLDRLKELTNRATNDTNSDSDRKATQDEIDDILNTIDGIANETQYNGKKLLSPPNEPIALQVGMNSGDTLKLDLFDARVTSLGLNGISVLSKADTLSAMDKIDTAIDTVTSYLAKAGSTQSDLLHLSSSLSDYELKLTAGDSKIEDADVAKESLEFAKNNIITQATQALLSHTINQPESVLQLLK